MSSLKELENKTDAKFFRMETRLANDYLCETATLLMIHYGRKIQRLKHRYQNLLVSGKKYWTEVGLLQDEYDRLGDMRKAIIDKPCVYQTLTYYTGEEWYCMGSNALVKSRVGKLKDVFWDR